MEENNEKLGKAFTLRVSVRLYNALAKLARRDKRRFADYVRLALEEHVEKREGDTAE